MRRRRTLWVMLGLAAVVGSAAIIWDRSRPRLPAAPQYTDLDTALAPEKAHGWQLSRPPKRDGPYRLLAGGAVLARTPDAGLECRLRDESGAVVEEIKLRGIAGCDQSVVYLETADGRKTMAALKRVD